MPNLKPIPIRTKGLSLFMRIWTWLFCSRKWELQDDWYFDTEIGGKIRTVFIKKGFVFDGASVPRFMWWLLNPIGILLIPGLVHDYAYRHRKIVTTDRKTRSVITIFKDDQKYWDKVFRNVSIQVNGCNVISYVAWFALYCFGFAAWKKNRKLEAKNVAKDWESLEKHIINKM